MGEQKRVSCLKAGERQFGAGDGSRIGKTMLDCRPAHVGSQASERASEKLWLQAGERVLQASERASEREAAMAAGWRAHMLDHG